MAERLGKVAQVFTHQRHVGGFDGHVGAHRAHRDPHVGGGQRGSVVDAITDHRGGALSPELFDQPRFVFGAQLGVHVLDPDIAGQRRGGGRVVAGEHRHVIAVAAQPGDHLGGLRPQLVAHGDGADHFAVVFDEDRGGPGPLHAGDVTGERAGVQPAGAAQAADVRSVYLGADGLFASLRPGTIVVDSSTIDVATARLLAEDAAAHQLRFLDAPVSGGVKGAEAATLTFMVGGDKDTLEAVMPILEPMSGRVISAGGAGTGQAAKIVNNMIMGVSTAATCEGILLAQRIGLDPSVFFEIATTSTCDSWVIRTLFPAPGIVATAPSSDGYAAGFMTKLMVKDLALAVEAAKQTATPATVTETALAAYADAMNNGFGELDCTSLYLSMSEIADEMARTADSQASA